MYFIGDIVGLGWLSGDVKDIASGIVSRVTETAVTVAFEETADSLTFDDDGPFKLVKLANDVTHKRIKRFVIMQGSKFKFEFGSTCATRCKFLGALPKF